MYNFDKKMKGKMANGKYLHVRRREIMKNSLVKKSSKGNLVYQTLGN